MNDTRSIPLRTWMANAQTAAGHRLSIAEREAEVRKHMQDEIRKTAERQAKRDAKMRRDVERHTAERIAAFPDRAIIIKTLGMLRNDNDGETLNAARAVERIRAKVGLSWSKLIVQIVPPFDPGVE
jgi:hypothetical protein